MSKHVPPVSVHESAFDKLFLTAGGHKVEDSHIQAIYDVVKRLRLALEAATQSASAILNNPMGTYIANAEALSLANERRFKPITKQIDAIHKMVKSEIDRIDKATAAPAETPYSVEIRGILRAATTEEREKAVREAIKNGDDHTVAAILHGPRILSGIGEAGREMMRDLWRKTRHASDYDRMQRLRRALNMLARMTQYAVVFVVGMVDNEAVERAKTAAELARRAAEVAEGHPLQ